MDMPIERSEYPSVLALTRRLKEIFGPNKSIDQYRRELANVYMKPNENILDYVKHVKELCANVIEGETNSSGVIDTYTKWVIECKARDSFINGLPRELVRVKLTLLYVGRYSRRNTTFENFGSRKSKEAINHIQADDSYPS